MSIKVNGMNRRDLIMKMIKQNIDKVWFNKELLKWELDQDIVNGRVAAGTKWIAKLSYSTGISSRTEEIISCRLSIRIGAAWRLSGCVFLDDIDSGELEERYGISKEKVIEIFTASPNPITLRKKDILDIESIAKALWSL